MKDGGHDTLLKVRFAKEDEAYVPCLNRLSTTERRQLYHRLSGGDAEGLSMACVIAQQRIRFKEISCIEVCPCLHRLRRLC